MENKRACAQYACLALNRPPSVSIFNRHLAILATCPNAPGPVALLETMRESQNMTPSSEAPSNLSTQPRRVHLLTLAAELPLQILSLARSLDRGDQRIANFDIAQRSEASIPPAQPIPAFFSSAGRPTTKPESCHSRRPSLHSRAAMA
jgi:hypothetical protein